MFDLIVAGASIVDGSGSPPLAGDIAVHGDRIAAVGKIPEAQGRRVIRAQGLIACPGFVDVHSHSDYFLLLNPRAESAVRQGVTTEIGGNCGYSAAPIWGAWGEDRAETYREVYGLDTRWHGVQEYFARGALGLIEEARPRRQDVCADRYPYTASNTGLQAVLPSWALEGSRVEQVARLRDATLRERLDRELVDRRWDRVMIAEVTRLENRRYEGLRVHEAAALAGKNPVDFVWDLLGEEEARVDAIFFTMSEENLEQILTRPYVMVASDSGTRAAVGPLGRGRPHPRTFGTLPRVLRMYVREKRLIDLPTAIRKMTFDPCRRFGLTDRGLIAPGTHADLVLFAPEGVRDRATYEEPLQYPDGIRYVLVNGAITVEEGEHTGARGGRVLRHATGPTG